MRWVMQEAVAVTGHSAKTGEVADSGLPFDSGLTANVGVRLAANLTSLDAA